MRYLDRLHSTSGDAVVARALGTLLAGALILLWAGLRLARTPVAERSMA